jgi:uncharacterized protein DUF3187
VRAGPRLLLVAFVLVPTPVLAADDQSAPDGPVEIRDEQVLAQDRLTLPPIGPDTVPAGRWSAHVQYLWCNSFGWAQDIPGEFPYDRRFLVDGETGTLDLSVARGLGENTQLALRLPLRWRGGGVLDGLIDAWHRALSLPDGGRPFFLKDAFRVEGITPSGQPFSWNDETGAGLGNLEVEGRWRFHYEGRWGWRAALSFRVALPTGTGPFGEDAVGAGLQAVAAKRLGGPLDLFLGMGALVQGGGPVRGVEYETGRVHGFLALEWRVFHWIHLVGETDIASRLVSGIDLYPGLHWITNVSGRIPLSRRTRLELGFTENFKNQASTTDFGLHFGLLVRP